MVLQDQAAHSLLLCGCELIKQAGGLPDGKLHLRWHISCSAWAL